MCFQFYLIWFWFWFAVKYFFGFSKRIHWLFEISTDLHQALIKMLAQMLIQGGGGKSDTEIDRLFRAVARGDTQSVRSICQNNRSLVRNWLCLHLHCCSFLFFWYFNSLCYFFLIMLQSSTQIVSTRAIFLTLIKLNKAERIRGVS